MLTEGCRQWLQHHLDDAAGRSFANTIDQPLIDLGCFGNDSFVQLVRETEPYIPEMQTVRNVTVAGGLIRAK
jgi:hypothetical protein